ncbi:RNA 3'-terminal phosphate cyclase (ATP) [Haloferula luteola]|uniref:RNA 3'-terminal phosphate cyclase n=1 Tax=Haloferula luteola TaxID=595692 RepID=A0A840V9I0_9BACT|nr:RNA 3'-terminal phosphate cyclase [Haloferula luteola]MBB5350439.1 RNA 3'-terminal phosphate cyclase (ATP) [Haloferula luteola]
MKVISLDGSAGGGQMLRTALSLSVVTGQPFRMNHLRGARRKPGLMRQHLACVRAACAISGGTADGAEIGSTELVFRAGKVRSGTYEFAVGTAGSTGLVLQTVLPALWQAGGASEVKIFGGTHNPMAPPFEFLERVYLPALAKMGARAQLELKESGFAPVGGGCILAKVEPWESRMSFDVQEPGELVASSIRVPFRELPVSIAGRMMDAAVQVFPCEDAQVKALPAGPGMGVACLVEAEFQHTREMTCTFGAQGVSAERLGRRAGKAMRDWMGTGSAVGRHLADQLLLPMALAGGGSFTTMSPDSHVETNLSVIHAFLGTQHVWEDLGSGRLRLTLHP